MIMLDVEERRRFEAWCREQAEAQKGLAAQMKRIRTPESIVKRFETEAAALLVVAHMLGSTTEEKL